MELIMACILVGIAVLASLTAVVLCNRQMARSSERWAQAAETAIERAIAFRGVNSPEAQCIAVLSESVKTLGEQMMTFTAEGRDLLKEKELARTTIRSLEMQISAQEEAMANMGLRRGQTASPPRRQPEPETVGAFERDL